MPGVLVVALGRRGADQPQTQVTDGNGGYRFIGLPAESYDLVWALDGFHPFKCESAQLTTGENALPPVTMVMAPTHSYASVFPSGSPVTIDRLRSLLRLRVMDETSTKIAGARCGIAASP